MSSAEIRIPDIGDFADVPVIEIHVSAGSVVAVDDCCAFLEASRSFVHSMSIGGFAI